MKATAIAPANIAFIKYWGKKDETLRIPVNDSISMNLNNTCTTTTVEFSSVYKKDEIYYGDNHMEEKESARVIDHLDRIRKIADIKTKAKIATRNNFPRGVGIASSASGFAALTLAASKALGLKLPHKELSILARLGSGSACRSIADGFVQWKTGKTSNDSYAFSIYNEKYWDLRNIIIVVSKNKKKITSTKGHGDAESSIFYKTRIKNLPQRIGKLKETLRVKDIKQFGEIIEEEAVELHTIMMTQKPPLFYWNSSTIEIINRVHEWRVDGLNVYFTIDAGPNVHLICEGKEELKVLAKIKELSFVKDVIINTPSLGARITEKHLF